MSDEVYQILYNILIHRKKRIMIDGYPGCILLDQRVQPNVKKSGMNPKTLQYLMKQDVTLNTYIYFLGGDDVKEELERLKLIGTSWRTKEQKIVSISK